MPSARGHQVRSASWLIEHGEVRKHLRVDALSGHGLAKDISFREGVPLQPRSYGENGAPCNPKTPGGVEMSLVLVRPMVGEAGLSLPDCACSCNQV